MKTQVIEKLKAWSEDAILIAELEGGINCDPGVETLRELIAEARQAGLDDSRIEELIWSPYSDEVKYSAYSGEESQS